MKEKLVTIKMQCWEVWVFFFSLKFELEVSDVPQLEHILHLIK